MTASSPSVEQTVGAVDSAGDDRRPTALVPGTSVGRYIVLGDLGRGAMGVVHAAFDPQLDRRIALKLLDAETTDPLHQTRMLREAQALARLSDPNVVAVHDVGTFEGRVFVAMELVAGQTLRRWLEHGRTPHEVVDVMIAAARGLAAAHTAGLVHRDFKPDNVMIGDDGRVRVMDFGLARPEGGDSLAQPVEHGAVVRPQLIRAAGTPAYMAPEQYAGIAADARADQFAFCVVLHEALYGVRPFEGATLHSLATAIMEAKLGDPPAGRNVPAWIRRVIVRGLAAAPGDRFATMTDVIAALESDPARARRRWLFGLGGVAAVGAAVWSITRGAAPERCTDAAAHLAGVWDADRRAAVADVFAKSDVGFAATTWERLGPRLDVYAERWLEGHHDACAAAQIRGEQSADLMDRRMRCLGDRRRAFVALVDTLAVGDVGAIEHAIESIDRLPRIERCAEVEYVQAQVAPPDDPALAAEVEEVREVLARARAMWTAGRFEDAERIASEVQPRAVELGYAPLVAEVDLLLGQVYDDLGRVEDSEARLRSAFFAARRQGLDEVSANAATLLVYVASSRADGLADATEWAEHADAEVDRLGEPSVAMQLLVSRGILHQRKGELDQARAAYEEVLAMGDVPGGEHRVLAARANLGNTLRALGKSDEAVAMLRKAIEEADALLGPDHPRLITLQNNLANGLRVLGELEAAEEVLLAAAALAERSLPPKHPEAIRIQITLGNVESQRGRPAAAVDRLRGLVKLGNAVIEPHVRSVLWLSLAHAEVELGRFAEARADGLEAVAAAEAIGGADHIEVGRALAVLVRAHVGAGELAEAEAASRRGLAIFERALPPDHPEVANAIAARGVVLGAQRRYAEAIAEHERAVAIMRSSNMPTVLATIVAGLGASLLQAGRTSDALAALEEARQLFAEAGESPLEASEIGFTIATTIVDSDRKRALDLAHQYLEDLRSGGALEEQRRVLEWLATHGAAK